MRGRNVPHLRAREVHGLNRAGFPVDHPDDAACAAYAGRRPGDDRAMGFLALKKVSSVGLLTNTISPLGIDFGVGSLKILQIGQGEPPSLVAAACVETPDDIVADHAKRLEFQTQALQRLVKSGGFKNRRAICSIPATQMFCKHLQLNKSGEDLATQAAAVIPAQLGCHPDALTYRQIVAGDVTVGGVAKQEVICFAVPRELIRRLMDVLKSC